MLPDGEKSEYGDDDYALKYKRKTLNQYERRHKMYPAITEFINSGTIRFEQTGFWRWKLKIKAQIDKENRLRDACKAAEICIRKKLVKAAFETWIDQRYQIWAKNRALLGKIFEKANLRFYYLRYLLVERWQCATWDDDEWEHEEDGEYYSKTQRPERKVRLTKKEMENIVKNINDKSKHVSSIPEPTRFKALKNANVDITDEGKLKLEMMLNYMGSINQSRKQMPAQILTA